MRKKWKALCVAATLAASMMMTACGQSADTTTSQEQAAGTDSAASTEDMYTVRYAYLGTAPADLKEVEAEANKYLAEKAGIQVELYPLSYSEYNEQVNLMITSNEKLDVMTELSTTFTNDVAANKLLPLDDLLDQYGADAKENLGGYVDGCKVGGKIYALPSIRDMAASYGVVLRTDAVEATGMNVDDIKTTDDLTNLFAAMKEARPDNALIVPQTMSMTIYNSLFIDYDSLGNSVGVLMDCGQGDMTVVNLFDTDEYEQNLRVIRDWYQKGYILSDVATNTDDGKTLMNADKIVGITNNLKPGMAGQVAANWGGVPATVIEIFPALRTTAQVQSVSMAIPITCKDTEAAMKFLNLVYSDPYLINLLDNGIEGKHYVKTDVDNVITFPEGVDASNSGYCNYDGWMRGNQLLSYVWEGDEPTLYEQMKEFNDNAKQSKAFGFTFDASNVKSEMAAITNVLAQYQTALEDGTLDIDENLPKFRQALKDAGIDKVIEEKQNQLDAWVAENN